MPPEEWDVQRLGLCRTLLWIPWLRPDRPFCQSWLRLLAAAEQTLRQDPPPKAGHPSSSLETPSCRLAGW